MGKLKTKLEDSQQQVSMLHKSLSEKAEINKGLDAKVTALSDQRKTALTTITDLISRCDELSEELESSKAKNAELVAANERLENAAAKASSEIEAGYEGREKQLKQQLDESEANVKRLSDEVVFAHEEISRLQSEKEALKEENESLLEEAGDTFTELQVDAKREATRSTENDELSAKVDELRKQNEEQTAEIKRMKETEELLQEINKLERSGKEVAVNLAKKELAVENEYLRKELKRLKATHKSEKDQFKQELASRDTEEEDLNWKLNTLTQTMNLRMKEKDDIISQYADETAKLKQEIQERDAEKELIDSRLSVLPKLEKMVEESQIELEQKDVLISSMESVEAQNKAQILRMQTKVDYLEGWLHETLNTTSTPPLSPAQSSNPQSPIKSTPQRYQCH